MTSPISGNATSALQQLQARQAFHPRPARNQAAPQMAQPEPPAEEMPMLNAPKGLVSPEKIRDIQQVAGQLGYVGLSEGAIARAMIRGESLLADVRA